jgi:thiol:disulfide interchange protein DsbD
LPIVRSFLVFTCIGLGLSAPYLVLSIFPSAVRWLPRPGPWMVTLRQFLAFPLYATVAWLVWVLAGQTNESGLFMALLGLVVVAMGIWLYGRYQPFDFSAGKGVFAAAAAALLLAGGAYLGFPRPTPPQELSWEPWSEARVKELRQQGRPIYVDFTARWCATCQTNKKLVFGSGKVRERMRELNVALLKADWTNADPAITRELSRWNRSAVPFDLIYLPAEAQPRVLPELLTPSIVLNALSSERKAH